MAHLNLTMILRLYFVFLIFVIFYNKVIRTNCLEEDEFCYTPSNSSGICINIRECDYLVSILKSLKTIVGSEFSKKLKLLQRSQCGFEGKYPRVCCPEETLTYTAEIVNNVDTSELPEHESESVNNNNNLPDVSNHKNLHLLNHSICGPISEQKIFGGYKTGVLEFPWMALLGYIFNDGEFGFYCGGTVINKRYILTAAHCVTGIPKNGALIKVRLGEHDVNEERDCEKDMNNFEILCAEKYQEFGIESISYNRQYSKAKFENDIALIRIDRGIDFGVWNIKPICLPIGSAAKLKKGKVTVTGWGATETGLRSSELLRVHLSAVPIEICAKAYNSLVINHKNICAGGQKRLDSCTGDSGGPLQRPAIYDNDLRFVQYGIVSFGRKKCGVEGFPGVYTNVAYFVDWILDNIKE